MVVQNRLLGSQAAVLPGISPTSTTTTSLSSLLMLGSLVDLLTCRSCVPSIDHYHIVSPINSVAGNSETTHTDIAPSCHTTNPIHVPATLASCGIILSLLRHPAPPTSKTRDQRHRFCLARHAATDPHPNDRHPLWVWSGSEVVITTCPFETSRRVSPWTRQDPSFRQSLCLSVSRSSVPQY